MKPLRGCIRANPDWEIGWRIVAACQVAATWSGVHLAETPPLVRAAVRTVFEFVERTCPEQWAGPRSSARETDVGHSSVAISVPSCSLRFLRTVRRRVGNLLAGNVAPSFPCRLILKGRSCAFQRLVVH